MKKMRFAMTVILFALTLAQCNYSNNPLVCKASVDEMEENKHAKSEKEGAHVCAAPVSAEDSAKFISKQVSITGEVETPLRLTVDSLKKMNVATIENFKVVCQSGTTAKDDKTCKGVLLKDILEKAGIKQANHKDRNFYIVARASDNYKATFSWAEIFNNPTGENTYVLFEENDMPIKEQGDMILICKNDIKTGPRHVYWLKSIEVNRVE